MIINNVSLKSLTFQTRQTNWDRGNNKHRKQTINEATISK